MTDVFQFIGFMVCGFAVVWAVVIAPIVLFGLVNDLTQAQQQDREHFSYHVRNPNTCDCACACDSDDDDATNS